MISFVTPQPLPDAVAALDDRTPLGSVLRSAQWARVPAEMRNLAFFSAGVESERLLHEMQRRILSRLRLERDANGSGVIVDRSLFVKEIRMEAERLGLRPTDETRGTLQDIGSERRLRLIWDTQLQQAHGYSRWRSWNDPRSLNRRPAAELRRVSARRVPRDWPARFQEAIDELGEATTARVIDGTRMVALINDPVWVAISRFGNPFAPFDFNSGMGLRRLRRSQAEGFGLLGPDDVVEPVDTTLTRDLSAAAPSTPERVAKVEELSQGAAVLDPTSERIVPNPAIERGFLETVGDGITAVTTALGNLFSSFSWLQPAPPSSPSN